jgi:hypothetical protein
VKPNLLALIFPLWRIELGMEGDLPRFHLSNPLLLGGNKKCH